MFKILVLQRLFNLSDDQTEFQILDRSSFRRFLGIETKIPDAKTIWHFKDELVKAGIIKELFEIFEKELENKNIKKQILDKGFRNKKLTNEQIESNYMKSKTRCRIEHVFGFITKTMFGKTVRSIGIKRAEFNIGLTNLIYNMFRYNFIMLKN